MKDKNHTRIVLISLVPEAIDLSSARINQQGVILQRTPIPPVMFDYACVVDLTTRPVEFRCVFMGGIAEQLSTIRTIGLLVNQWFDIFRDQLLKCGYQGQLPTEAAKRWALANRYVSHPIDQDLTRGSLEKMRCPRCLSEGYRGATSCLVCKASFALQVDTAIYYPTPYFIPEV